MQNFIKLTKDFFTLLQRRFSPFDRTAAGAALLLFNFIVLSKRQGGNKLDARFLNVTTDIADRKQFALSFKSFEFYTIQALSLNNCHRYLLYQTFSIRFLSPQP